MTEVAVYACSICNEPSKDICARCTKDACRNHRCERCKSCSDCCECEVPLTGPEPEVPQAITEPVTIAEPEAGIPEAASAPEAPASIPEPLPEMPAVPQASEEPDLNTPVALPAEHEASGG